MKEMICYCIVKRTKTSRGRQGGKMKSSSRMLIGFGSAIAVLIIVTIILVFTLGQGQFCLSAGEYAPGYGPALFAGRSR